MKNISLLLLTLSLTACLQTPPKVTNINTKDGKAGYAIRCGGSARSWAQCFERASELCGANGYKQYAKNTGRDYERSLIIACKDAQ